MVGSLINDLFGTSCSPEVLDGRCLIREVRPYRTSQFQLWSGVKVNIGEQREFRLVLTEVSIVGVFVVGVPQGSLQ